MQFVVVCFLGFTSLSIVFSKPSQAKVLTGGGDLREA